MLASGGSRCGWASHTGTLNWGCDPSLEIPVLLAPPESSQPHTTGEVPGADEPVPELTRHQSTGRDWSRLALHSQVGQRAGLRDRGLDCLNIVSEGVKQASSICFLINKTFDLAKMSH